MQDETTICWHTHRGIWLLEQVQSYVVQTGFLYVNCFDHIKLDHGLIHALIERWIRETHMFHLKHGKMTPTLQDVMILLGLPIDRMTVISTGVYNRIVLYERTIGLTPPSSKSKGGSICFKSIKETFSTPPDDDDEKVLWRYKINYDLNMLIICYNCVNYYDNFNLIIGMSEHIYFISLALYYLLTSQRYMFICFIWCSREISMSFPHIAEDMLYWHPYIVIYVLHAWKWSNMLKDVCYFYKYK